MAHKIAVLGASLGGMIAAAELRRLGCEVTVIEKGHAVGGLYGKVDTPFGSQELGMHVIYVDQRHYTHLCDIFGHEVFHVMRGPKVDLGGSANFGKVYFGSHYPSLLGHPLCKKVLQDMLDRPPVGEPAANARDEAVRRFGITGGDGIVVPILRKLWGLEPRALSRHALHCFFDLRRMAVVPKAEADRLKDDPALDDVIANPDQTQPKGEVFGGRMGLVLRQEETDLAESAAQWAKRAGVVVRLGGEVKVTEDQLLVDGVELNRDFDACLVAMPIQTLAPHRTTSGGKMELSIYYHQLETPLGDAFPSYYILMHDPVFASSRVVNYDSYGERSGEGVLAVEAVHALGQPPPKDRIAAEVCQVLPEARIVETFQLPRSVPVLVPSLANGQLLDSCERSVAKSFGKPIFFTGMRTDTGNFFSHHTIGLAYDSALACIKHLS